MVLDAVANFVRGTSTESINDSQTTIPVDDASIFPDPSVQGEFNVVIWDANNFPRPDQDTDVEIMRVTARDTTADELTVTRAQEMTSAAAHPEGSAIHLSPTAKMFSDIESTFGDFWDAGTQELTADVNNTNTTTESLEADESNIGQDPDISDTTVGPLVAVASGNAIAVQSPDDSSVGYRWYAAQTEDAQEKLAEVNADTIADGQDINFYTKDNALGSGESQLKRMQMGYGSDEVGVTFRNTSSFRADASNEFFANSPRLRINPATTGNDDSPARLVIRPVGAGNFGEVRLEDNTGNLAYTIRYNESDDVLRIRGGSVGVLAELDSNGDLSIVGNLTENADL